MTNLDKQLFLVICSDRGQHYVAEREMSRMNKIDTLRDIVAGEWTNLVSVIEFNAAEHIASDVTEEFARAAQNLWADREEPLKDWQKEGRIMRAPLFGPNRVLGNYTAKEFTTPTVESILGQPVQSEELKAAYQQITKLTTALEEALEYFKDNYDVVDCDDGTQGANKEMRLGMMIDEALHGTGF